VQSHAGTGWIAKHACRTLIKQGHPRALTFFGFGKAPAVQATLTAAPAKLMQGGTLTLTADLVSTARTEQRLVIDYVMHYVRAGGGASAKVFKWTTATLAPGAALTLTKWQAIRDFSTRKHYPGTHLVELQVNGRRVAEARWVLALQPSAPRS
jgi:hypothetical protein